MAFGAKKQIDTFGRKRAVSSPVPRSDLEAALDDRAKAHQVSTIARRISAGIWIAIGLVAVISVFVAFSRA